MTNQNDEIDQKIHDKIHVFTEHLNDQFRRVIEAVTEMTAPIADMAKQLGEVDARLVHVETEVALLRKDVAVLKTEAKATKEDSTILASQRDQSEAIQSILKLHEKRIAKLEAA